MNMSWIALILATVCIAFLGAGCSSNDGQNDGCCAACSPPPGVCPGDMIGDGGVGDAMGDR
jgi:hypothetical protein